MPAEIFWIDLFAGAGGTSTGIHISRTGRVIACVNHDPIAIASHKENHPYAHHFVEDVRTLNVLKLKAIVDDVRRRYPGCRVNIWASLECTHFSKAKGGRSRDEDSRTLAYTLYRYLWHLAPDALFIENVREFLSWGPLDPEGFPIKERKGEDYSHWLAMVSDFLDHHDHRLINSADLGAIQSRERYFAQFMDKAELIAWPEQTHSKTGKNGLPKWRPVRIALDLYDEGVSIFARKKPLSSKTIRRILAGCMKFVPEAKAPEKVARFIKKYFSGDDAGKCIPIDGPCGTIKTIDNHAIVKAEFLSSYYSGSHGNVSIDGPAPTATTKDRHAKVTAFIMNNYTGGGQRTELDSASSAVLTNPKQNLVSVFVDQQFGNSLPKSVDEPCGALTGTPKYNQVMAFMMNFAFDNGAYSVEQPAKTIVASRRHQYLVNPQWNEGQGCGIDAPSFTIIARLDKAPPHLVTTVTGRVAIAVYDTDCPDTVRLKQFMAANGIADIKMRMLRELELKRIQGFPDDYVLKGTKTQIKKAIGNAVEVTTAAKIAEAHYRAVMGTKALPGRRFHKRAPQMTMTM